MPQNRYGMGVAAGDYDNDGFADLYVTGFGGNTLYRNNGDGTFTDVTARAGVGGRRLEHERRLLRLRQRRQTGSVRGAISEVELRRGPILRRAQARRPRLLPSRQLPGHRRICSITTMATARSPMCRAKAGIANSAGQIAGRGIRRFRRRRLDRYLRRQRLRAVLPLPQQPRRHVHRYRH